MADSSPGIPSGKRGVPRQGVIVETTRGVERHLNVNGTAFRIPERYNHLEVIGKGSYGMVCSAIDSYRRTTVAIKKITPMSEHSIDAKRALREVRVMRYLGAHENIVTLEDLFSNEENDELYIIMELLESDLHRIIQSPQTLSTQHHRVFMLQIFRGVKFLHDNGIIHRDLKPGNILVTRNCELRISDFGLARAKPTPSGDGQEPEEVEAMTEHVITRWYRPPELMLSPNGYYGFSVDIWSIGCIFGELIGRRPLFPGTSFVDQLCLIFDVIGAPAPEEVEHIQGAQARKFLREKESKVSVPLEHVLPGVDIEAASLLKELLVFDPDKRCSAGRALLHPFFATIRTQAVPRDDPPEGLDFRFEHKKYSKSAMRRLLAAEVAYFQSGANLRVHSTRAYAAAATAAGEPVEATPSGSTGKGVRRTTRITRGASGDEFGDYQDRGGIENPGLENSYCSVQDGDDSHTGDSPGEERNIRIRGRLERTERENEVMRSVARGACGDRIGDCVGDSGGGSSGGSSGIENPGLGEFSCRVNEARGRLASDSPDRERKSQMQGCILRADKESEASASVPGGPSGDKIGDCHAGDGGGGIEKPGLQKSFYPVKEGSGRRTYGSSGGDHVECDPAVEPREVNSATVRSVEKAKRGTRVRDLERNGHGMQSLCVDRSVGTTGGNSGISPPDQCADVSAPSRRLSREKIYPGVAPIVLELERLDEDAEIAATPKETTAWHPFFVPSWRLRSTPVRQSSVAGFAAGVDAWDNDQAGWVADRWGRWSRTGLRTPAKLAQGSLAMPSDSDGGDDGLHDALKHKGLLEKNGNTACRCSPRTDQQLPAFNRSRSSSELLRRERSKRAWEVVREAKGKAGPAWDSSTADRHSRIACSSSYSSNSGMRRAGSGSWNGIDHRVESSATNLRCTSRVSQASRRSFHMRASALMSSAESCHDAPGNMIQQLIQSGTMNGPTVAPSDESPYSSSSHDPDIEGCARQLGSYIRQEAQENILHTRSIMPESRDAGFDFAHRHAGMASWRKHKAKGKVSPGRVLAWNQQPSSGGLAANTFRAPIASVHHPGNLRQSMPQGGDGEGGGPISLTSSYGSPPAAPPPLGVSDRQKSLGKFSATVTLTSTVRIAKDAKPGDEVHREVNTKQGESRRSPTLVGGMSQSAASLFSTQAMRRTRPEASTPLEAGKIPNPIFIAGECAGSSANMRQAPRPSALLVNPTGVRRNCSHEALNAAIPQPSGSALSPPASGARVSKATRFTKIENAPLRLSRSSSDSSIVAERGKVGTVRFEEPPSVVERRAKKGYQHEKLAKRALPGRLRVVPGKAASFPNTKASGGFNPKVDLYGARSGLTTRSNHGTRSRGSISAGLHIVDNDVPGGLERNQMLPSMAVTPGEASAKWTKSQQQRRPGSLTRDDAKVSGSRPVPGTGMAGARGNIDAGAIAIAESKFRILQRLWEHPNGGKKVGEAGGSALLGLSPCASTSKAGEQLGMRRDPASSMSSTPGTPLSHTGNTEAFDKEAQGGLACRAGGSPSISTTVRNVSTTINTSKDVEAMPHASGSDVSFLCQRDAGASSDANASAFSSTSVPSTLVAAAINPTDQNARARQRRLETLPVARLSRLLPFRRLDFADEDQSTGTGKCAVARKERQLSIRQVIPGLQDVQEKDNLGPSAVDLGDGATDIARGSSWRYRHQREGSARKDRLESLSSCPAREKPEQRVGIQAGILRTMRAFPKRRRTKTNPAL